MEDKHYNFERKLGLSNLTWSFTSGFVAGVMSKYFGHPLDTIKIRIQISGSQNTLKHHFSRIIRREGFSGLFKGVVSPVMGYAPMLAVLFSTNDFVKRTLEDKNMNKTLKEFLPGCWAGFATLSVIVPLELLKVKKQGRKTKTNYYAITKEIVKAEGIKGMYSGFWISFWRCVPQYGLYFFAYQKLQEGLKRWNNNQEPTGTRMLRDKIIAGGLAGQIGWFTSYPFDAIKTYIQYHPEHTSLINTVKHVYKEHGALHFYRGCSVALIRAFPVNAITFVVYDYVHQKLKEL